MEFLALLMSVLAADRVSKLIVTESMQLGESIKFLGDYFHWTFILNEGAAFGMFQGARWIFITLALIIVAMGYYFRKDIVKQDWLTQCGVACFIAGTIGNLIDRALFGAVIDFIDLRVWPIFNVADMGVCLGVALLLWSILWQKQQEKHS
ncbi:MAG: signal peptidase II [Phascolarctobacterium sp.]|nr:signal peptidase II [Phascolarctobacterium sp.]